MGKIAIDIVLLPPDDIMNLSIKINSEMINKFEPEQILNKETCMPHATVLMGVVDENNLGKIYSILGEVAKKFFALDLTITKDYDSGRPNGDRGSTCFEIEKTKELMNLQEELVERCKPFLSYDGTIEMLFNPPEVNELSLHWLNGFLQNSVGERYTPHITLGLGDVKGVDYPIKFRSSRLAVCHLGNFCTCRKIFGEVALLKVRKAVGAVIEKDGKYLLVHKTLIPKHNIPLDEWGFSRGGIEEGEDIKDALMRELKEETGSDSYKIIKELGSFKFEFPENLKKKSRHEAQINTIFLAEFTGDESELKPDGVEINELKWFSAEDALEIMAFDEQKDFFREKVLKK